MPPPFGITLPCALVRVIDGDTVVVRITDPKTGAVGLIEFHVRLLDCWAPEVKGASKEWGLRAKRFVEELLANQSDLRVFVPLRYMGNGWQSLTTMGRVLGELWCSRVCVGEAVCQAGYAQRTKAELEAWLKQVGIT